MSLRTSVKGWFGEALVSVAKKIVLDGKVYQDVNNVTIAVSDGTTQIDHIIVSRYGIFVIETKNFEGWIFGSADKPQWTQSIFGNKSTFQNPLRQNYRHIKSLEEFLGLPGHLFHSVVCFVGSTCVLKTSLPENVIQGEPFSYIKSKTDVLLLDSPVAEIVQAIKTGMRPKNIFGLATAETRKEHLDSLKSRHEWGAKQPVPPSALVQKGPPDYLSRLMTACAGDAENAARLIAEQKARAGKEISQDEAIKQALEKLFSSRNQL